VHAASARRQCTLPVHAASARRRCTPAILADERRTQQDNWYSKGLIKIWEINE
jgi:hypothetical protein